MENDDPVKKIKADYIKLTILMLQQIKNLGPVDGQRMLRALDLPDDHLIDIYKMLKKGSEIKPMVKEELEKRGILVD